MTNPKTGRPLTIGVIPARYGSQRLPAKPLVDLLGKPLVQRVYEQAKKATLLDKVVVATDDERIAGVVRSFGGDVLVTSPAIASGSDRVAAVAAQVGGEIFVNVQGDEPLIAPEMIDQAIRTLQDDPETPVATLAKIIDDPGDLANPAVVKVVVDVRGRALYFSRSPIPHVRDETDHSKWIKHQRFLKHIGLYVFRKSFLIAFANIKESALERAEKLEQLRILEAGEKIAVGITDFDSIPVDTSEDVARVCEILSAQSVNHAP